MQIFYHSEPAGEQLLTGLSEITPEQVAEDISQLQPNVLLESMKAALPNVFSLLYMILSAIIILLIGFRVADMARKLLARTFERMEMELSLKQFLETAVHTMICGIFLFMAAERIGISSASIIAILGSAGLALGLALQGQLSNLAGGILLLILKPFRVGDYISSLGQEGTVTGIGLIYTTLCTIDNRVISIPNGTLSNSDIINVSAQPFRKVEIKVGISYDADLKQAKTVAEKLCRDYPLTRKPEELQVYVDDLADSAVMIGLRVWVDTENYWKAKWDLTEGLKLAYDREGIEIPYMQVDIHTR